ncbi:thiol-disulfide oxidoreductase DCC family protein [Tenacibaculum sp. UWU-22]|uniref:thiol-disulfide oxidoreductase DCC family protein n=1 Tax=Tenacibaculum sp. UWU-22 TaxID=3234187 RepID=UPI0034DB453F
MFSLPKNKKIILFDGGCALCNKSVLKIIKNDRKEHFIFTAIQSNAGKKIVAYLGVNDSKIDTIILYEPGVAYYVKSTAVLKIMADFGGIWQLTQICFIFPKGIRDLLYTIIAKNRYKWFGKNESCMLLSTKIKNRFFS